MSTPLRTSPNGRRVRWCRKIDLRAGARPTNRHSGHTPRSALLEAGLGGNALRRVASAADRPSRRRHVDRRRELRRNLRRPVRPSRHDHRARASEVAMCHQGATTVAAAPRPSRPGRRVPRAARPGLPPMGVALSDGQPTASGHHPCTTPSQPADHRADLGDTGQGVPPKRRLSGTPRRRTVIPPLRRSAVPPQVGRQILLLGHHQPMALPAGCAGSRVCPASRRSDPGRFGARPHPRARRMYWMRPVPDFPGKACETDRGYGYGMCLLSSSRPVAVPTTGLNRSSDRRGGHGSHPARPRVSSGSPSSGNSL